MALTVGELHAILSIDDRAVNPSLRRAEQALRQTGQQMGDDAQRAGQDAGRQLGQGLVRGADGQWRNMRGELADAATAAVAEAEMVMRRGGQRFAAAAAAGGQQAGDALADGLTEGADQAVEQAGGKLDRLKMAAAGAGAAAGAVLIAGFQEAMSQGQITARLGAQLGTTGPEAARYGKIAGQLFKDAIVTDFQAGADAIKAIASSGLIPPGATNAQIKSIAANASDLASIMEVDVGMAAQAAGTMVKNGLAKDGKEAFDLLVAGSKGLGKAGEDLLETFTEYSPVFAEAGLSGKTAMGLIRQAVAGGWGKDTDKVADAFKELQLRVGEGGKAASDSLKALGLDYDQVISDMRAGGKRGEGAMDQITDKLRKLGPTSDVAKQAVKDLFGGPGEDLGAAAYKLNVDQAAKAMGGAKDAADDLGNGLRDNAATRVTQFKNSLQQNLVEFLGGQVIPKLEGFFNFAKDHSGLLIGAAAAVTALGAAFSLAAIGVWAMNSAMLANPMFWIIAGVAAAVAGLVLLIVTYWDEIKAATMGAWSWVVSKVIWAKDGILSAVAYLGTIPGKVAAWFGQAKDWAVRKFTELTTWLQGLPGRASGAISGLGSAVVARANSAWQSFRDASVQKALAFVSWVRGLPGRISSGIGSLGSLLVTKGVQVVQGLWSGIKSMGSWIYNKILGWAKSMVPGPIAKALGISSPSKVTRSQGRWIARGLVDGLTGSSKQVKAASTKLADIVADSLAPGKKRTKALKRIGADSKKLLKLASQEQKVADRLKKAQAAVAGYRKERDKLAADVKKGVLDDANITKQDSGGWPQTAESILAGLQADTAAAQLFAKNLAKLRAKGVRSDLIAQIAQAGVSGGSSAAAALANANSGQIKQINAQQHSLVKAAEAAGSTAGNAMYGAGIQAANGLISGLKKQQSAIEKQMLQIAKGMSKSIRAALGIKSPSRVMAMVGHYTGQGLIDGIKGEEREVNKTMASLVDAPPPVSTWGTGAAGRGRRGGDVRKIVLEFRSNTRGEDDYLMGRMQRTVRRHAGPDVQFAFTGRRSG
ncbi:phage tail tape measure protein [Streptomyces chartreusis]|uniref:phage tail tape measure protein n=1 Tax=Streptomyces chartreusis TaxID=1969 RepID=UPI0033E0EB5E